MKFYLLLLFTFVYALDVFAAADAHDKEWLRLLNYKKGIFGYKSEADGKDFFLSAHGKTNPEEELATNIDQIFSPLSKDIDKHARCRFPARAYYLSKKLNKPLPPEKQCLEFEKFKNSFEAESLSLVFSAYYINNPSSTFGHTFLRVNKKDNNEFSQNTELLDLGVNFAANPWTKNPIVYTFGGMVGLFPGVFSTLPYYYKVREYNDFESRDLWSYKLNLTKDEIDQFIRHLWELGQTHFDYFFFTENCSYHILTAIEAAAPRYDLSEKLPSWAIPSDTILVAEHTPGFITDVHYRPSARNIFLQRYSNLSDVDKKEFLKMKPLEEKSQVDLVDTNLDWMEYKNYKDLQNKNSVAFKTKEELLMKRTEFPPQQGDLEVRIPDYKPHEGHPSMRLGIETGDSENFNFYQKYHLRFALHDLMDPDYGYPENMQIEFFNFIFKSYDDLKKWNLDRWTFVSVKSLAPFQEFEKKPSWDLQFGIKSYSDDQCAYCQGGYISNSWGLAYDVFPKATFYAYATGDLSYSQKYKDEGFRALVGPKLGVLYKPKIDFKFQLEGTWYYDPFQEYDSYVTEFSLRKALSIEYAIGASAKIENDVREGSVQFFYYH
jgi:hypothetical protein